VDDGAQSALLSPLPASVAPVSGALLSLTPVSAALLSGAPLSGLPLPPSLPGGTTLASTFGQPARSHVQVNSLTLAH